MRANSMPSPESNTLQCRSKNLAPPEAGANEVYRAASHTRVALWLAARSGVEVKYFVKTADVEMYGSLSWLPPKGSFQRCRPQDYRCWSAAKFEYAIVRPYIRQSGASEYHNIGKGIFRERRQDDGNYSRCKIFDRCELHLGDDRSSYVNVHRMLWLYEGCFPITWHTK